MTKCDSINNQRTSSVCEELDSLSGYLRYVLYIYAPHGDARFKVFYNGAA